jgi:hypothetical protein
MKNKFKFLVIVMILLAMTGIVSAADGTGTETTETFFTGLSPLIGAAVYGSYMYYLRNKKEGETFSIEKFLPTLLTGVVIAIFLYLSGVGEITSLTIDAQLVAIMPVVAESGIITFLVSTGLYGAVIGYFDQFVKDFGGSHAVETTAATTTTTTTTTVPVTNTVTATTPTVTEPVNLPDGGCTVNPSIGGKVFHLIYGIPSPVTVSFALDATQPTADHSGYVSVDIDWNDGTFQLVPLVKGHADVEHTFKFVPIAHYTGMTFNPVFTFNENTGEKMVVNGEGRTVEIGVESP